MSAAFTTTGDCEHVSDVGVAGCSGEMHTPDRSLTQGFYLPSEIYEIDEKNAIA